MCYGIPSGVGGNRIRFIGNKRGLRGSYLLNQREVSFIRVSFNVEFGGNNLLEFNHVCITDVSFVGARMYSNALSTKSLAINGRLDHVGVIAATSIA